MKNVLLALTLPSALWASPSICPSGYQQYLPMPINAAKVGSGTMANYPVYFAFNVTNGLGNAAPTYTGTKTVGNGGRVQNTVTSTWSGYSHTIPADLVFTAGDGNVLPFEIENYNASTGEIEGYVLRTPTSLYNVSLFMCLDNSSVTTDQTSASVWQALGYYAVYHLAGAGPSGYDSSGNGLTGTLSTTPPTATTGVADGGSAFVGSSSEAITTSSITWANTAQATVSFWYKRAASGGIVSSGIESTSNLGLDILAYSDGNVYFQVRSSAADIFGHVAQNDTNWHYAVLIWNGSGSGNSGKVQGYIDGIQQTLTFTNVGTPTVISGTAPIIMGHSLVQNTTYSTGSADELRILQNANVAQNWITTEYNNISNPATFFSVGSETASSSSTILAQFDLTTAQAFPASQWVQQPIDFRYDGGQASLAGYVMLGADGVTQIPYQWVAQCWDPTALKGCVEINDQLGISVTNVYNLVQAASSNSTIANPVSVINATCYSGVVGVAITNGLTGICIPTKAAVTASTNYSLGPIQGILLPNGSWTGAKCSTNTSSGTACTGTGTANYLLQEPTLGELYTAGTNLYTQLTTGTGFNEYFIDAGPLKTSVTLSWTFNRPNYWSDNGTITSCSGNNITLASAIQYASQLQFVNLGTCTASSGNLNTTDYYNFTLVSGSTYTLIDAATGLAVTGMSGSGSGSTYHGIVYSGTNCSHGCLNSSPGQLTLTFTLNANSDSILVSRTTDMFIAYDAPLYPETSIDTMRGRNWQGGPASAICQTLPATSITSVGTGGSTATVTLSSNTLSITGGTVTSGQPYYIEGVYTGNTKVNLGDGLYYLQTNTGTTWNVWQDSALSVAVTNPGGYSTGGLLGGQLTNFENSWPANNGIAKEVADSVTALDYAIDANRSFVATGGGCTLSSNHIWALPTLMWNLPAGENAMWSMQAYQANGGSTTPAVGMFVNDVGLQRNIIAATPGWYMSNSSAITGRQDLLIYDENVITGAAAGVAQYTCCQTVSYGIWVNTRANVPNSLSYHSTISDDQNKFGGINLSHIYAYLEPCTSPQTGCYQDPAAGWKYPYLPNTAGVSQSVDCLITRVRDGTQTCSGMYNDGRTIVGGSTNTTFNQLYNLSPADTADKALLNMWACEKPLSNANCQSGPSGSAAITYALAQNCTSNPTAIGTALSSGDNRWSLDLNYYLIFEYWFEVCQSLWSTVLTGGGASTDNGGNGYATIAQKAQAKIQAGIMGGLAVDQTWFPIGPGGTSPSGGNLGLPNQITAYLSDQTEAVIQFGEGNPFLASYLNPLLSSAATNVAHVYTSNGGMQGSASYEQVYDAALMPPVAYSQVKGLSTTFNSLLASFTRLYNWYSSMLTPPDPRVGLERSLNSMGTSSTSLVAPYFGVLGTNLYNSGNITIGANAMWGWQQFGNNAVHPYLAESGVPATLMWMDPTTPSSAPTLTSWNSPCYHAVHRFGFGTANEGYVSQRTMGPNNTNCVPPQSYYGGTGHSAFENSAVDIWAVGMPIATSQWAAAEYTPAVADRFSENSIVMSGGTDNEMTCPAAQVSICGTQTNTWYQNNPYFNTSGMQFLSSPTVTEFQAFGSSAQTQVTQSWPADGTSWTRTTRTMSPDTNYPIIYVKDTFSGSSASASKTMTWNLEATGAVTLPGGSMTTPTVNYYTACASTASPGTLPWMNGSAVSLSNGLQSFVFTGWTWTSLGTNADFTVYQRPTSGSGAYALGGWGHNCTGPQANNSNFWTGHTCTAGGAGTGCEEKYILRINDTGPFETVFTPTLASGTQPSVAFAGSSYTATFGSGETLSWDDHHSTYSSGSRRILTCYDSTPESFAGMSCSGGAVEVNWNGSNQVVVMLSDVAAGARNFTLPAGTWYPSLPVVNTSGNTYTYYQGTNTQPTPIVITFSTTPTTIRSVPLSWAPPPGLGINQVQLKFGSASNYMALVPCATTCGLTVQAPVNTSPGWPTEWDYMAGSTIVSSSQVTNVSVQ
jgi:hypothetical protein